MAEMPDRGRLKFDELILRTVVRVLNEILGEAGASFLFGYLSRHGDLERERIPGELGKFREEIVEMLGTGGLALLNRIVGELAAEVDAEPPRGPDIGFEGKVSILRRAYLEITAPSGS